MKFSFELSQEDIDYLIHIYESALKGNEQGNQYANGTLYGFDCIISTLNQDIPGLTDKYKTNLGFEKE